MASLPLVTAACSQDHGGLAVVCGTTCCSRQVCSTCGSKFGHGSALRQVCSHQRAARSFRGVCCHAWRYTRVQWRIVGGEWLLPNFLHYLSQRCVSSEHRQAFFLFFRLVDPRHEGGVGCRRRPGLVPVLLHDWCAPGQTRVCFQPPSIFKLNCAANPSG